MSEQRTRQNEIFDIEAAKRISVAIEDGTGASPEEYRCAWRRLMHRTLADASTDMRGVELNHRLPTRGRASGLIADDIAGTLPFPPPQNFLMKAFLSPDGQWRAFGAQPHRRNAAAGPRLHHAHEMRLPASGRASVTSATSRQRSRSPTSTATCH